MSEWQPIETAPKDGTRILLNEAGAKWNIVVGRRSLLMAAWESVPGKYAMEPTHWMLLPAPPEPS